MVAEMWRGRLLHTLWRFHVHISRSLWFIRLWEISLSSSLGVLHLSSTTACHFPRSYHAGPPKQGPMGYYCARWLNLRVLTRGPYCHVFSCRKNYLSFWPFKLSSKLILPIRLKNQMSCNLALFVLSPRALGNKRVIVTVKCFLP
jgi:hypothetical protein